MSIPLVAVHCLLLQERGLMTTSKCVTHIQNTNSIQIQTSLNVFTVNICNVLRHIASLDNNSLYIGYSTHNVFSDVIGYTDIYFKFCRVADGGLFCSMLSYYDPSPLCFHSTVFWVFSFSFCTVTFCVFACLPSTWLIWWQCLQGSMDRLLYMKTCHILPQNWKEKIRMHILAQKKMKLVL